MIKTEHFSAHGFTQLSQVEVSSRGSLLCGVFAAHVFDLQWEFIWLWFGVKRSVFVLGECVVPEFGQRGAAHSPTFAVA